MKIFAYRVVQNGPRTLATIADRLHALDLQNRFFGGRAVRLEERGHRTRFLLLDFAKERGGHGPGRMARNEALQEIPLRQGQNFGEDTALAYDPQTGYAAVQYNHFGPRVPSIEEYLYSFDLSLGGLRVATAGEQQHNLCGFKFGALLKRDAYERIRRFGIFHDIAFTVAHPGVEPADLEAGRSLGDVLRAPFPQGVETITVTIKAAPGRAGALDRDGSMGILNELQHIGADLKHAVVRGKITQDDPFQTVDLVEERISTDAPIQLGRGQRYSRADRWGALADTLHEWLDGGIMRAAQQ